jgi:hypothetical protein
LVGWYEWRSTVQSGASEGAYVHPSFQAHSRKIGIEIDCTSPQKSRRSSEAIRGHQRSSEVI